ncbi:MAG: DUF5309 family protein [Victivallaceae bacterium]
MANSSNPIKARLLGLPMRDLGPALDTVMESSPRFVTLFNRGGVAYNQKHEWLQDTLRPRTFETTSANSATVVLDSSYMTGLKAGMQFVEADKVALFEITSCGTSTFTYSCTASRGLATSDCVVTSGAEIKIVGYANPEFTSRGDGESTVRSVATDYNFTQIIRKYVQISDTAIQTRTYDEIENNIAAQTEYMLKQVAYDMNAIAVFGNRSSATASVNGTAGGLYDFGTQSGCLAIANAASATRLDCFMANDAAALITDAGGNCDYIYCSPGQARVLSNDYRNLVTVDRGSIQRGTFVAQIVNDQTGKVMTIICDDLCPDTEAWALDSTGLLYVPVQNRDIRDYDTTTKDIDGVERTVIGEFTLEFKNSKARLCRIKNLSPSATELALMKSEKPVSVTNNITITSGTEV